MSKTLDLTNVINVSIVSNPTSLNTPNINTVALISQEIPIISFGASTYRIYTSATDVKTDWGSSSKAYKMAVAFFSQNPNPLQTNGYLVIVPRLQTPSLETVQDALARIGDQVFFAGFFIDEEMHSNEAVFVLLTAYVQTLDKLFFYASSDVTDYAASGMLDDVRTASKTHTRCLYYSGTTAVETQEMAAAYAGRAMSVDFGGSNTATTLHLKSLATINPDLTIDTTQLALVQAAGVDVYVSIVGVPGVFTSGENSFFDEIYNELWFKFALQTAGFNYLRTTNTKVPQTDSGIEGLKNEYRKICDQAVSNGFIGPGTWTSSETFGSQESLIRNIKDIGYYIYATPLSAQTTADRALRKAPLIQIAAKASGAVHKSNVQVNVDK